MTYTKTITVNTDWLSEIDGLSVAQAIAYLQTLDQTHILFADVEGSDTHGVELVSRLHYDVPMTNADLLAYLEAEYGRQLADREKGKQYYIDRGQLDRVPNSDKLIAKLRSKLEATRVKYGSFSDEGGAE